MVQWIGVNTEYLTESIIATTVSGTATSITTGIQLSAVTATATASGGVNPGDIIVTIPESVRVGLSKAVSDAAAACGVAAKLRRRAGDGTNNQT
jgi:long-subunit fatty acid transport protein